MGVSAKIDFSLTTSQSGANAFGGPYIRMDIAQSLLLANGTGANQFDKLIVTERTVASGANDDIDLAGVLTDALGTAFTAAELVALAIINKPLDPSAAANTTNLTPGGGTNTVPGYANARCPIGPGDFCVEINRTASGLATVTAGTGDIIRVANSAGAQAKYLLAILARSA
jgi:hypothetical protein